MKLRIATKIAAGYLVLTLMILILGVHGYNNSKATEYQMQQVDILNDRVDVEKAIQLETYAIMSSLRGFTATGEESYKEECIDRLNKTFELVEELQSIAADGNREAVENLKNLIIKYQQQVVGHTLPAIEQRYSAENEADLAIAQAKLQETLAEQAVVGAEMERIVADLVEANLNFREQYIT